VVVLEPAIQVLQTLLLYLVDQVVAEEEIHLVHQEILHQQVHLKDKMEDVQEHLGITKMVVVVVLHKQVLDLIQVWAVLVLPTINPVLTGETCGCCSDIMLVAVEDHVLLLMVLQIQHKC
jgi:hypothetical protein